MPTASSLDETTALASDLAKLCTSGDVVTFSGDLGVGKTSFVRGVVEALAPGTVVQSPTFNIVHIYDTPRFPIWHVDLYRLEDVSELSALGLEEAFDTALTLIEWPEIAASLLPRDHLHIKLSRGQEEQRQIDVVPLGLWQEKIKQL